ncbi:hypothetical protein [Georgenia alba]|uniref:Uncharacterized protein n=1 Tax=Georgenia alba TaxID=2233858 RepID=A0ABW2Q9I6_9MICO
MSAAVATWLVAAVVVVALALSAGAGSPLVATLLRRIEGRGPVPGVLRGGTWIGILERLAITGSVLAGYPEAVAVVLAIKGLGRYPELRETHPDHRHTAAERFIIGTLASYLWAGVLGVTGALAVGAIS